jgi:hypothetical protein
MSRTRRTVLLALTLSLVSLVGVQSATAAGGTVVFQPGEGTSVADGKTICVMGTSKAGVGSVICSGMAVHDALFPGTTCDEVTKFGCILNDELQAVRLKENGRPKPDAIMGVGGYLDVKRGQKIKAGKITGKRLDDGGFRFVNASGHGFTLTNMVYVAR